MVLDAPGQPLRPIEREIPRPQAHQILIRVGACGVCRTDLHLARGEIQAGRLPVIPGHQIVGVVLTGGEQLSSGTRVGIPWLGWTCGRCRYCRAARENLCEQARFTGCDSDGGYAEYVVADERYCFALPDAYDDLHLAPLLCAGMIGYRALGMLGDAERLGLYGFGASAHIVCQIARHQGRSVFAFTRPNDTVNQAFARDLGAHWAGSSLERAPEELDGAIIFASAGELVPIALAALAKGAAVVCAGIHMSAIPSFPYEILWGERSIRSVANLTRKDARELLSLAEQVPLRTEVKAYALSDANQALSDLHAGAFSGALVLKLDGRSNKAKLA
jgi:alcohol dehydrogenase, propanol-preferring